MSRVHASVPAPARDAPPIGELARRQAVVMRARADGYVTAATVAGMFGIQLSAAYMLLIALEDERALVLRGGDPLRWGPRG